MKIQTPLSNTQSLQMLQAQQAFRPRPSKAPEETKRAPEQFIPVTTPTESVNPIGKKPALPIQDIQNVATQAGFVDVSQQDIEHAYRTGSSLLADYRA